MGAACDCCAGTKTEEKKAARVAQYTAMTHKELQEEHKKVKKTGMGYVAIGALFFIIFLANVNTLDVGPAVGAAVGCFACFLIAASDKFQIAKDILAFDEAKEAEAVTTSDDDV